MKVPFLRILCQSQLPVLHAWEFSSPLFCARFLVPKITISLFLDLLIHQLKKKGFWEKNTWQIKFCMSKNVCVLASHLVDKLAVYRIFLSIPALLLGRPRPFWSSSFICSLFISVCFFPSENVQDLFFVFVFFPYILVFYTTMFCGCNILS